MTKKILAGAGVLAIMGIMGAGLYVQAFQGHRYQNNRADMPMYQYFDRTQSANNLGNNYGYGPGYGGCMDWR